MQLPKCFQIEQPKGTPAIFSYEIMDEGHSVSFKLFYGVSPSEDLQIRNEIFNKKIGHVTFNVDNSGYFTYCLQQLGTQSHPTVRLTSLPCYPIFFTIFDRG
jgi:hypothetical protein